MVKVNSLKTIGKICQFFLFIIHSMRMCYWYDSEIWNKPLLWGLYVAYGMINLAFLLTLIDHFIILRLSLKAQNNLRDIKNTTVLLIAEVSLFLLSKRAINSFLKKHLAVYIEFCYCHWTYNTQYDE
jgi:hypothetical protein